MYKYPASHAKSFKVLLIRLKKNLMDLIETLKGNLDKLREDLDPQKKTNLKKRSVVIALYVKKVLMRTSELFYTYVTKKSTANMFTSVA